MPQQTLTQRQQRVFDFIVTHLEDFGNPPTIREIASGLGFRSPNGVVGHLKALQRKGVITRSSNKSRAIRLTGEVDLNDRNRNDRNRNGLPLAGRVAAGMMTEAVEQHEQIDFGDFWNYSGSYVLEVEGESMIEAHICPGDYLVVRDDSTASPGDIVIARTSDGEATVKYWFPEKDRVRLQPANASMSPIYTRDASVIGVVIGVVRKVA